MVVVIKNWRCIWHSFQWFKSDFQFVRTRVRTGSHNLPDRFTPVHIIFSSGSHRFTFFFLKVTLKRVCFRFTLVRINFHAGSHRFTKFLASVHRVRKFFSGSHQLKVWFKPCQPCVYVWGFLKFLHSRPPKPGAEINKCRVLSHGGRSKPPPP